jgi:hypothetical protein
VFWLLLGLLLLVCVLALGVALLSLWRRVKALGRTVAVVGESVGEATEAMNALKEGGPLDRKPCPTCGAPASAATKTPAAVHAQDLRATPAGVRS